MQQLYNFIEEEKNDLQEFTRLGALECHPDGDCFQLSKKHIYRLDRGYLKIVQFNDEGHQRVKYIITPGDLFGSLSYLMHGEYSYTEYGVAVDFVQLSLLSLDEVQRLCKADSGFENKLLLAIGKRIIKIEKRLDAMVFGDSDDRVINFIREYLSSYGKRVGDRMVAPNLLTHQEISTLTATSRQTVTRVLNRLRTGGIIEYNTRQIASSQNLLAIENQDTAK